MSVRREPPVNNLFLAVHRFRAADDLSMLGDISQCVHQTLGIPPREAEQREKPCLTAIVRVGLVQEVVEHLAAMDDGQVGVTELHGPRIVPRRARAPFLRPEGFIGRPSRDRAASPAACEAS